jgi:hypothetical protein
MHMIWYNTKHTTCGAYVHEETETFLHSRVKRLGGRETATVLVYVVLRYYLLVDESFNYQLLVYEALRY